MNIAIRTDACREIGSGHVMRCMTLADRLSRKGCKITFIMREFPNNLIEKVRGRGYAVRILPCHPEVKVFTNDYSTWLGVAHWQTDAEETQEYLLQEGKIDWLIVDHYGIDSRWESRLRPSVEKIMVIDDLANRTHDCDVLLDQNYSKDCARYEVFISKQCIQLLGPKYALVRPEFLYENDGNNSESGAISNILITFGGSDSTNETLKVMQALNHFKGFTVIAVLGATNTSFHLSEQDCNNMGNVQILRDVENMADLMKWADIAVGASGSTMWERMCVGLPTLVISVADNQIKIAEECADKGAIKYLGHFSQVTKRDIVCAIEEFVKNPNQLKDMVACARRMVDAKGTERVAEVLFLKSCNGAKV